MNEIANSDTQLLNMLRRAETATVAELAEELGVTATAVRQRLSRMMAAGLVSREAAETVGRGRPSHQYRLTSQGRRKAGSNFSDLAMILWQEVRSIDDRQVRSGLMQRIARRMADMYRPDVRGATLTERMRALAEVFSDRHVPFEVVDGGEQPPLLNVLACPYPELAEQDRAVCSMERMMISDLLGENTRLNRCRLDGHECCSFQPSAVRRELE